MPLTETLFSLCFWLMVAFGIISWSLILYSLRCAKAARKQGGELLLAPIRLAIPRPSLVLMATTALALLSVALTQEGWRMALLGLACIFDMSSFFLLAWLPSWTG